MHLSEYRLIKKFLLNQYLFRFGTGGARGVNSRSTKTAIGGAIVKPSEDGWRDIVGPYSWDINISSSIAAARDASVTKKGLNMTPKNDFAMCKDES